MCLEIIPTNLNFSIFIQDSFQYLPLTISSLLHHTKIAHFWMCLPNFSWRINFLKMQRNLIAACSISKIAALPKVFFYQSLRTVQKTFDVFKSFFSPFQQVTLYHSDSCVFLLIYLTGYSNLYRLLQGDIKRIKWIFLQPWKKRLFL